MAATRGLATGLCGVVVALSVAACGGGGDGAGDTASAASSVSTVVAAIGPSTTVVASSAPAAAGTASMATTSATVSVTPPTTTAPPATTATTAPGVPTVALDRFVSPSGNIACAIWPGHARCDVQTRTWSPPPKPASCEFDWGGSMKVTGQGPGFHACASDSTFGVTAVLAYGTRSVIGSFACTSAETGMTCRNTVTGHGFSVSRDDYSVF